MIWFLLKTVVLFWVRLVLTLAVLGYHALIWLFIDHTEFKGKKSEVLEMLKWMILGD